MVLCHPACIPVLNCWDRDSPFLHAQGTDLLTKKAEVPEDCRDVFVGDVPIREVVSELVGWSASWLVFLVILQPVRGREV